MFVNIVTNDSEGHSGRKEMVHFSQYTYTLLSLNLVFEFLASLEEPSSLTHSLHYRFRRSIGF